MSSAPVPESPSRLLIVRTGALGDIVHALPVLAALREACPQAAIDWLVDARYAEVLSLVEGVSTRLVMHARDADADDGVRRFRRGGAGLASLVRFLRHARYDVAIDLQGLIKSGVLTRLSGAPRRIGFVRAQLREPAAAWAYTEGVAGPEGGHVVHKNLAVLAAFGQDAAQATIRFPWRPLRSSVADAVEASPQVREAGGYVVMNAGAAWPNKRWAPERFGALAARLRQAHGLPSIVLWGPGEEMLAAAVVAASEGAAVASPPTALVDVLALAAGARLVVSGDTGPLHLAASVGAPLVALFGPTRPERNGPWRVHDVSVSRADVCVCHHKRRCLRGRPCLDDVPVEDVAAACARRLATERAA